MKGDEKDMNKRTTRVSDNGNITVDIDGLQAMLCLGRASSEQIASAAGAVIRIGKRKVYHVGKIEAYMESLATA